MNPKISTYKIATAAANLASLGFDIPSIKQISALWAHRQIAQSLNVISSGGNLIDVENDLRKL
jgi:hypothetical protein